MQTPSLPRDLLSIARISFATWATEMGLASQFAEAINRQNILLTGARSTGSQLGSDTDPVNAVRRAQAAQDWELAARLLFDQWFVLALGGHAATAHELVIGLPAGALAGSSEFAALMAGDELLFGSLGEAERYLAVADDLSSSLSADRVPHLEATLALLRLLLATGRGDLPTVVEEADRLLTPGDVAGVVGVVPGYDRRAVDLISLGIAELGSGRVDEAERHLERGIVAARGMGWPYLETTGLAYRALGASMRSAASGAEHGVRAIELARRHGWSEEPNVAVAYLTLGATSVWQGRLEEAATWLGHGERALRAAVEPAAGHVLYVVRGVLELARGCDEEALGALRTAERLGQLLATSFAARTRAVLLHALVKVGETERVAGTIAQLGEQDRQLGEVQIALAALALAKDDTEAATDALAPVLDGSAQVVNRSVWLALAFLLEAIARDAQGDADGAERALGAALDVAAPDGTLFPFLLYPVPSLLERHSRHRTAHASLISRILKQLAARDVTRSR